MRSGKLAALVTLFAFFAMLMAGCRRREQEIGRPGAPIVMVLSSAHGADAGKVKELEGMLRRETGLEIELRVAPDSEATVRMTVSPNTDVALLTLFEYLFCRRLSGVTAGLRVVRKGGAEKHHAELVVKADSNLRALSDLAGKKVAYVNRYSSTGWVLPAKLLADAHVSVEPVFTGSHEASIAELIAGHVAAAATYSDAILGHPELRTLADTAEIPNEPVVFRPGLSGERREKIVRALIKIASSDDGRRVLGGMANIAGFVPANDNDYEPARKLITSIVQSEKDLVPRGWILSNEQERKPGDLAP